MKKRFMKRTQKGFAPVALIVILVILAGGGYILVKKSKVQSPKQEAKGEQNVVSGTENQTITDETTDWKTYRNEKYGFEVKYPSDWKTFDSNNSASYMGVAFGKENADPNYDGELFIQIRPSSIKNASQVIAEQELTEKQRLGNSVIQKQEIQIDGIPATLLIVKNSEINKSVPTWEFDEVIFERNGLTYVLGNGAFKSDNFEEFYKSFKFTK